MPASTTPLTLQTNPTTITNAYSVSAASAIYGPAPTAWSVTNTTTIQNLATTITNALTPAFGILLANGGTVTNNAGAAITSGGVGVAIKGAPGTASIPAASFRPEPPPRAWLCSTALSATRPAAPSRAIPVWD